MFDLQSNACSLFTIDLAQADMRDVNDHPDCIVNKPQSLVASAGSRVPIRAIYNESLPPSKH
jgi:hypothetical protein